MAVDLVIDIENTPGALAQVAALVPQSTFLFDDTVRGNITLGADIPDEDVWAALRLAQGDGFVAALPNALDTVVGERGTTLSGGQRQRLALACAVSTAPQLLLADEPTSQLSHEDRDHVIELIHDLADDLGTTIVVVTHQPEVAATFPRTVTMKGGRVGAEGRHGAEYVVIGAEGVVHLPTHLAEQWPQGTLVRIEPEDTTRLVVSKPAALPDAEAP